ncbi:helix-turn-helix transcriptional regulator [Streptomyces sp. NBC_00094]|uniref:helix-turn-helix transcriptional regulator n=1 Tax=Streptomyces sp. NBC_00094 TaxID=2903620 RepID=UPI00224F3018|nr:helix-turn-helix transcriptional regulator [Streptomyces sp. NBC_00094]MCX5392303.1 helix-turn-helix transcriptional regulator [Streptomyces sp. NBC_00094]
MTLYQELRRRGVSSLREVGAQLRLAPQEYERCRDELSDLGLIVPTNPAQHGDRAELRDGDAGRQQDGDTVAVIDPEIALLRLLHREREQLREHLDEADRAYGTLETLAGSFLRAGSLTRSDVDVELLSDYRRIQQVLEDITDVIQHSLASMHLTSLKREVGERVLSRDRRQIENGVRVRAMYSEQVCASAEVAEHLRRRVEAGVEVRIASAVPMPLIIADAQFAVVPVDPAEPAAGAVLARGPALVRSYLALYEHCWHTALPYGDGSAPDQGGDGLSEQQRAALRMLASGMKDEKIARGLGVSLRTVSRMLSELMQEMGATSRFEAGVRAYRLGWVD